AVHQGGVFPVISDARHQVAARPGCGEALVGASGGRLARPLVELLAQVGATAGDVQAQAAVLVPELPGAVGEGDGLPQPVRGAVLVVLDHRGPGRGRGAQHDDVHARVLVLQLPVAARHRVEPEILVGLAVAGPLFDGGAVGGALPVHVYTQA